MATRKPLVVRGRPVARSARVVLATPSRALRGGYAGFTPAPCRISLDMHGGMMDPIPVLEPPLT